MRRVLLSQCKRRAHIGQCVRVVLSHPTEHLLEILFRVTHLTVKITLGAPAHTGKIGVLPLELGVEHLTRPLDRDHVLP